MTQVESPEDVAVAVHLALAAAGLSDMVWGHVSVRLPDGSGIVMKSSGWGFEEITPQRLVRVSWEGQRLAGEGTVHIEVPIHTRIMAARPEVQAVVHTHAPAVTAFASLGVPLRAISHDGVPFAFQLPRFERTGNLIDSAELGDALAHELGTAPAIVIPQHGSVTVGRTVGQAVMHPVLLQRACTTFLAAAAAGGPAVWSDDAELSAKLELVWSPKQMEAGYRYLARKGAALT